MVLEGALSNPDQPVKWRELAKHRAELLTRRAASASDIDPVVRPRKRPHGWIWKEIRKVIAAADRPITPTEAHAKLEHALGEQVPYSTVKDCLRRHAQTGGDLRRLKGGLYRLR